MKDIFQVFAERIIEAHEAILRQKARKNLNIRWKKR